MAIKHVFVSAKTQGTDATVASANEWNSNHTIDSEFTVPVVAAPAVPAAGVNVAAQSVGGRIMLGSQGIAGGLYQFQPHIGRKKRAEWIPNPGDVTITQIGCFATSSGGTSTGRQPTSTNYFSALRRIGKVSGAIAGNVAGFQDNVGYHCWRGNGAGLGGFHLVIRFGVSDAVLVGTARMFAGLVSPLVAPSDVDPSTLTNIVGIGCNNGDTVMQLYMAGAAAQARVSLGANFPVNTISTDAYELIVFCAPNGSAESYQVTRLNTGDVASGTISTAANLLANTQFVSPVIYRSNGGAASAVSVDLMSMYLETDA